MVQMLQIGQEMERAVTGSEKHSELREGTLSSIGREETGGGGGDPQHKPDSKKMSHW